MLKKIQHNFLNFVLIVVFALATPLNTSLHATDLQEGWLQKNRGVVFAAGLAAMSTALYYLYPSEPEQSSSFLSPDYYTGFSGQYHECFVETNHATIYNPYSIENVTGNLTKIAGWIAEADNPLGCYRPHWNHFNFFECWVRDVSSLACKLYEHDYNTLICRAYDTIDPTSCELSEGKWIKTDNFSYVQCIYDKLLAAPEHLSFLKKVYAHQVSLFEKGYETFFRMPDLKYLCPEVFNSINYLPSFPSLWWCGGKVIKY